MDPTDPIAAAVEAARAELLDPGLDNPLIRARVSRTRGVEIVDERAVEVHRIIVGEGHAMDFVPEGDARPSPEELGQPQHEARLPQRHVDRHLQTPYPSAILQRRLVETEHAARTLVEEQGHNALCLALGALRWTHGDTALCSPLLLVPAVLERQNARCRFTVRHSEEEPGPNLSLSALLRAAHGFELPPLPDPFDFAAWLGALEDAVAGRGWQVDRDAITLDLFDARRFLLYRDLDPAIWPPGEAPHQHRVIRAVLGEGFGALPSLLAASAKPPEIEVVDADTSQTEALALVAAGCDVVIQGPPGTGKSQTITNLIAQAVARGEKVLFVAEKLAALDVVHRRLERVGLGAACLELHSHKTSKKAVLAELRRTLDLGRPEQSADHDADRAALDAVRERLVAHDAALTAPLAPTGLRPVDAIGRWHRITDAEALPRIPFAPMAAWDRATLAARRDRVAELQAHVAALGQPAEHPFFGCTRTALGPAEAEQLGIALEAAAARSVSSTIAHAALAAELGLPPPDDMPSAKALRAIGQAFADAPDVDGMERPDPRWHRERAALEDALDLVDAINRETEAHPELLDEAWPEDVLVAADALVEARAAIKALADKWWRVFSGRWRAAKATVAMLGRDELPDDPRVWHKRINAIIRARRHVRDLEGLAPLAAALFRARWRDRHLDAELIRRALYWLAEAHRWVESGEWPAGVRERLGRPWERERVRQLTYAATSAEKRRVTALAEITAALGWVGLALDELPAATLAEMLDRWRLHLDRFPALCRYNRLAAQARDEGLDGVVELAEHWPEAATRLVDAFEVNHLRGVLALARSERPAFGDFDPVRHRHAVERFRALDRGRFAHDRATVAGRHFERVPRGGDAPGMTVLRREMEKKARHLPLRRLFVEAREAVQAVKPVFLMSPMSVAGYLAPEGPRFDLVVFDEASQVRPVDALGALNRARRAVVVGDSRQLPPTRFFQRLLDSGDLAGGEHNVTADLESVLGLFVAAGAPSRMLRWHYRSRHPSLVAVSNHLFYGDALTLFPSPVRDPAADDAIGLAWRHLPDAVYDRGGTRQNAVEARAIARAVVEHALTRPQETLGVVAFSAAQADAIREAIERRRRTAVDAEGFFAAHLHEPFFVKNLENVQGDERDVILLSVGYARAPDGRVWQQFGPLNLDGGERRLNVAITRARRRCMVYTGLEPEDIDPDASTGLAALRTFLAFARDGHLSMAPPRGRADAPFEDAVAAALEARGHAVHRRVGDAGCAVALAVVDPERPVRYLLGVDCDGADGERRIRDAIRLRPQVLRGLGWHLHRVWAAAWHRDPVGEINAIEAALAEAREGAAAIEIEEPIGPPPRAPGAVERLAAIEFAPFAAYDPWPGAIEGRFTALAPAAADAVVLDVVHHEAPLTYWILARRIIAAGGASRLDARLQEALDRVLARLSDAGSLRRAGMFIRLPGAGRPSPRDRKALTRHERRATAVPPEELEAALIDTLRSARTLGEDELFVTTARRLGLPRSEAEWEPGVRAFESALGGLLAEGRARRHDVDVIWEGS